MVINHEDILNCSLNFFIDSEQDTRKCIKQLEYYEQPSP